MEDAAPDHDETNDPPDDRHPVWTSHEKDLRSSHELIVGSLEDLRSQRDDFNRRIKELVEEEIVLRRAIAVFDRENAKREQPELDPR